MSFLPRLLLGVFAVSTVIACSTPAKAVDVTAIEKSLTTTGVEGWVHGASNENGIYVFTFRAAGNFFDYLNMSLTTESAAIRTQLRGLSRHDKVRVKGKFLDNPSPQKHIDVQSLEVLTKFTSAYPAQPYHHEGKVPDELLKQDKAVFLVHAVASEGRILVVEHKDVVMPIFVKKPELTKNLWRNDLVELTYTFQREPDRPVHLRIKDAAPNPVRVLSSIKDVHGKPGQITGRLIMFPKSPEVKFNVFAIEQELQDGLKMQYTVVNFDDADLFAQIRAKLQAAWDRHPGDYVNGRNKLVSTKIRVSASGTLNEVDPGQANPQVLINKLDDVKLTEE